LGPNKVPVVVFRKKSPLLPTVLAGLALPPSKLLPAKPDAPTAPLAPTLPTRPGAPSLPPPQALSVISTQAEMADKGYFFKFFMERSWQVVNG
jgi:hypothetical protein